MILSDYEEAVEKMAFTETEKKATQGMPAPVAYGFVIAARKSNKGRKMGDNDWSAFSKKLFGL